MSEDKELENKEDNLDTKEKEAKKVESKSSGDTHEDDSIKWRAKYKATKEELETIRHNTEKEKGDLSSKIETAAKEKQMFEQKYIDAEVKAQAVAAGIKDIDLVKLIDKADIKLDDKGELVGVDKAIADFKAKKPDWFGSEKKVSTSKNADFPDKSSTGKSDARTLSSDEWKKNKARYMAGQF